MRAFSSLEEKFALMRFCACSAAARWVKLTR